MDVKVDVQNLNLRLDLKYLNETTDLKLKFLSFVEKFDFIDVKIPDQRLQEIWNLFMTTEMMQDFLIEDLLHHYFIKSLPVVDLSKMATISLNDKTYGLSVNEIPNVLIQDYKKYFAVNVGMTEVNSSEGFFIKNLSLSPESLKVMQKKLSPIVSKKKLDRGDPSDHHQSLLMILDASLLSMIASDMLDSFDFELNKIKQINSFLTLSNLRLVFPSLSSFYGSDDDLVNTNLSLDIQSN
jgi:6-pyruvoyl-tetrahydropterin synthase